MPQRIAEAPPKSGASRFFYFLNVLNQDSLFLETIKALYSDEVKTLNVKVLRGKKAYFLEKFKNDGIFLNWCVRLSF